MMKLQELRSKVAKRLPLLLALLTVLAVCLSAGALWKSHKAAQQQQPQIERLGASWIDDIGGTRLKRNGILYPKRSAINITGATVTDDSAGNATNLDISAGVMAAGVADLSALRALTGADYTNKQVRATNTPNVLWKFDSSSMAADDGVAVVKPNDIAGGSPGRWISIGANTTANVAAPVADLTALKALSTIDGVTVTDGQSRLVKDSGITWGYSSSTGAGFAGDDRTIAQPADKGTGSNGRWYPSVAGPVVPTIVALRAAVAGRASVIHVQAYSTIGDGGGGDFEYDSSDTTTADNSCTVIVAGTRRYKRRFSGEMHASWCGVKADGRRITDGVVTASSTTFTSATAAFTAADVGKKILLRTPSVLAQDTLTIAISNVLATVNGSHQSTDMPIIGGGGGTGEPASGGAIWVTDNAGAGHYYVVHSSVPSSNQFLLSALPQVASTAKPYYTQTQLATTIAGFTNSTTVTLGAAATLSETAVKAFVASDDLTPITNAITTAAALATAKGSAELVLPGGLMGISDNIGFSSVNNLKIRGTSGTKSTLVDLRKASDEYPYPNPTNKHGALAFENSSGVVLEDFGYDGSLPVLGIVHSAGGVVNAGGGRGGFVCITCANSQFVKMRSETWGSRDEHLYVGGESPNFIFDRCDVVANNNVSINVNNGGGSKGVQVIGGRATGVLIASKSYSVTGVEITTGGDQADGSFNLGASGIQYWAAAITVSFGSGVVANNVIHDSITDTNSSAIGVFGVPGSDANANILIANNTIDNMTASYFAGGVIHVSDTAGAVNIVGNTMKRIATLGSNSRFVDISGAGASTTRINVGKNHYESTDVNMVQGVHVGSDVPAGKVTVSDDSFYASTVTNRLDLAGPIAALAEQKVISSTGTTALTHATESAIVTANGTVTVTLVSPVKVPGKRVTVKNSTTQAGTTTVGTAAGNIDGSSTFAMAGANLAAEFLSDGTNWKMLSGSSVGGGVPSSRTITATSPVRIDGGASADLSANRTLSLSPLVNADISSSAAVLVSKLAAGTNGDVISTVAGVPTWTSISGGGGVPSTRTLTTTTPLRIDGGASADLSSNRTLSVIDAAAGTRGVIDLDTDLGGTAGGPTVVGLSGTAGIVAMHGTQFRWDGGVSSPTFFVQDDANNGVTGQPITFRGQNCTGTTSTGGKSIFSSGSGTSAHGSIGIQLGGNEVCLISRAGVGAASTTTFDGGANESFKWKVAATKSINTESTDLYLDSTTHHFRDKSTGTYRGNITSGGWRIGDSTAATHALEIAAGGGISWAPTVSSPTITQAAPTNADGQNMIVAAQSANGGNRPGGSLLLSGGAQTGSGAAGPIYFAPGGVTQGTVNALGARFGDSTAPSVVGLELAGGSILIGGTGATFGRFAAAAATAGSTTTFAGQDGTGSGDRDGGPVFVTGGAPANSGVPGRVSLNSDTKELVQAVTITNELRHVVSLARASNLTSTQMPSNSGDYVVYIGNTTSAPAANPVSGGILYVEAGALKYRGTSGTVTTLGNPFWSASVEGLPANDNGLECEPWQRDCAGWR